MEERRSLCIPVCIPLQGMAYRRHAIDSV